YADYASGLATAGTWASGPTTLQICMAPFVCKRPGDVVQAVQSPTQSVSIIPTTSPNLVKFTAFVNTGTLNNTSTSLTFKRAATTIATQGIGFSGTGSISAIASASVLDAPGTTASTAYSTSSSVGTPGSANSLVEEIMG